MKTIKRKPVKNINIIKSQEIITDILVIVQRHINIYPDENRKNVLSALMSDIALKYNIYN